MKMLGQQQVRPVLVHVELVQPEHIAPSRRAMLRAGTSVLLVGHGHNNHYRINHREHQQKAWAVSAPRQRKRLCQCAVQRIQQSRYFHARCPAASHRQRRPPHDGQRQQPNPPRILSFRRVFTFPRRGSSRVLSAPRSISAAFSKVLAAQLRNPAAYVHL